MSPGTRTAIPGTSGIKILMYHWVDPDPGRHLREWGLTPQVFEAQMRSLSESGHQVLRLHEVLQVVRGERPAPARGVALTFDDGYRGHLDHVVPVLERYGFSATFFLVSDRVGGTNAWDARHGDPPRALMGWPGAAALVKRGMDVGSHSRTHPFLPSLSDAEIEEEIRGSKALIEDGLGIPVRFFSYPHGLLDDRCLRLVEASGYAGACSSDFGVNGPGTSPFRLRRTQITFYDSSWSFSFKARTGFGVRAWTTEKAGELLARIVPGSGGGA